ncbi:MAG: H-NS family nucleoid-associated regulatory protein [Telluria sp.]
MDLTNMSVGDMRNLQEQIKLEMKKREAQEVQKAREQILAIAQSVGVPIKELLATGGRSSSTKGNTVAVRYRHPDNAQQQWTGRGRQPKWVKEWVEAGKSLDKLRV